MNHPKAVESVRALQRCPLCLILDFLEWLSKEGFWNLHPVEDRGLLRAYAGEKPAEEKRYNGKPTRCELEQLRYADEGASAPCSGSAFLPEERTAVHRASVGSGRQGQEDGRAVSGRVAAVTEVWPLGAFAAVGAGAVPNGSAALAARKVGRIARAGRTESALA